MHPNAQACSLLQCELSASWLSAGTMMVAQYLACLCDIAACLSGSSEVAELAHCTDNIAQVGRCRKAGLVEELFKQTCLLHALSDSAHHVLLRPPHTPTGLLCFLQGLRSAVQADDSFCSLCRSYGARESSPPQHCLWPLHLCCAHYTTCSAAALPCALHQRACSLAKLLKQTFADDSACMSCTGIWQVTCMLLSP